MTTTYQKGRSAEPSRHVFFVQGEGKLDMHLPDAAALAAGANLKPVPEWVHIMPLPVDGRIASRDYRELVIEDAEALVKRSNAALKRQQGGGLVDIDHRTYGGWFTAGGGPACGWSEEFELRDDGIYCRVDWLAEGHDAVASGQYRYTSSVVTGAQEWVEDENGYLIRLDIFPDLIEGFGLTNIPALETLAMFTRQGDSMSIEQENTRRALSKLGLEPATVERLAALPPSKLKALLTAEPQAAAPAPVAPVEPAATENESTDGEAETDDEPAEVETPAESAELARLTAENIKLRADLAAAQSGAAEAALTQLVRDGKMTPAQKKSALKIAAASSEGFAALLEMYGNVAPVLARTETRTSHVPHTEPPPGVNVDRTAYSIARQGKSIDEITRELKAQRAKENTTR